MIALFTYGVVLCGIFWASENLGIVNFSSKKRLILFVAPIAFSFLFWLGPNAKVLEPILGRAFNLFANIGMSCTLYIVPAIAAWIVLMSLKKNSNRWLYAAIPFIVAIIISVERISSIEHSQKTIRTLQINPQNR